MFDYDNDGWIDIFQANGSMLDNIRLYHTEVSWKEPKLMFRNLGGGKFEKVSEQLGADFMKPTVGRGTAVADFDNDGDLDIAISNSNDFPQLLRNDGGNANHWLEVMLVGVKSNRDGRGAALKLVSEGFVEYRQAQGGMSYMSAHDPRIHFGLGQRKTVESLEITWPSGIVDKLANVPINQIITVKEGVGIIPRTFPKSIGSNLFISRFGGKSCATSAKWPFWGLGRWGLASPPILPTPPFPACCSTSFLKS